MYALQTEPKAQAVRPHKLRNRAYGILFLLLVVAIALLFRQQINGLVGNSFVQSFFADSGPSDSKACQMAQTFVTNRLKAPSTAKFAPCAPPDTITTTTADNRWTVKSWVDAENAFGAMYRNDFSVTMIYYPSTSDWSPIAISIKER